MYLSPALEKRYTREQHSAREAQRLAEFIAWGPMIFQVSRLMLKFGILELLRNSDEGLTRAEIVQQTQLSDYAAKILLEGSLCIGTVLVNTETERYSLSKTGWFLLTDPATRVNVDFNHDVNYEGLFHLEEALREGRPAGLEHFGAWPTVYEGLSSSIIRAARIMDDDSRLCIMETLWDRQKYEPAALCLTMTSVYFTDIANGNSKMYNTEDMTACVEAAGLRVETIHDGVGEQGHSIMVCRR